MAVRVVSRRTVRPPPRPRELIPLTSWEVSMISAYYIQNGLLYAPPPFPTARLLDHLEAALAEALAAYYPVAGRFVTDTISTEAVRAAELMDLGHVWAAAAVGRAVAAHTIRAHAAAWAAKPVVYTLRYFEATCVMVGGLSAQNQLDCRLSV